LGRRLVAAHAARDAERFCGDALLLPGARHRLLHARSNGATATMAEPEPDSVAPNAPAPRAAVTTAS